MIITGKIFHGLHRGEPWIDHYFYRIVGLLNIKPFKGTLNIKLDKEVDISDYMTKVLEHVDASGRHIIEARFCPAKLRVRKDDKIIEENCWIFRQENGPYKDDVIEIISEKCLEKELGLKEGDAVEVMIARLKCSKNLV